MKDYNSVTKVNKFPKSKNKSTQKLSTYGGRNEIIDADLYYQTRDEKIKKKKKINELQSQNRKMDVTLKRNKINPIEGIYDIDYETLKIENENLKNKNTKMRQIIQGLKNENSKTKTRSRTFLPSTYEKNEYLQLISHLQNELKIAHDDRKNLLDELTSMKELQSTSTLASYNDNLKDKNLKLAELNQKNEQLINSLEQNSKILDLTKKGLQEFSDKYTIERNKNRDLETIIQNQKASIDKANDYLYQIEEYKKKEALLEERIKDLSDNPFIKQANERDKAFVKLRETQIALNEEQRRLKNAEDKIKELEKNNKQLEDKIKNAYDERDKYKEDGIRYKIANEEREKQNKNFDETFKKMSQFGEVDSNYNKMVNMLKGSDLIDNSLKMENGNWENMNFLEKMDEEPKDINELQKENQRLKIEKGILGNELEKTKKLLILQQEINNDNKKVIELDKEKYKAEIKYLKQQIQFLKDSTDNNRIPIKMDYSKQFDDNLESKNYKEKDLETNYLRASKKSLDSQITDFSIVSESDYGINENSLDLYITSAIFDQNTLKNKLNMNIDDLLSFISVDFYLHETQTSNLSTGPKINYNLQLTFRVNVDEYFINYLKGEYINIELYIIINNVQKIVSSGKISLNQLLNAENNPKTRVVHGFIEMFLLYDNSCKLCDIKYKMRMRKSLNSMLNWLDERNQLAKQLSSVNDANNQIFEENLKGNNKINQENDVIDYYNTNDNNRVLLIRILIIKAEDLTFNYPSRNMLPYLYYKFYRKNEHFSKILSDPNDDFNDMGEFTCIYNNLFHDYLLNESLEIYIFDDAKPIEVDVGKDVRMVREENDEDLIGICNINLKNLILVGKIQGKFEIRNNERKVGNLIIDMSCEEINRYDQKTININYTIKKDGVDPLLIKLAAFLRNKGLNMKSAFKLFDTNNENSISLDSFRSVISSIKFTDSNDEITKLMQIIFESKARIYQDDFTRIFDGLLPYDDNDMDFYNKNSKSHFYQNNMIDSKNMEFSINRQYEKLNKTGVIQSINTQDNINNLRGGNLKGDNFNSGKFDKNNQSNINRNIRDIMKQVNDYMIGFGAYNAIDLYKMFDYDGNTLVGKKEMADGFGNLGIRLSNDELEMIWYEIVENDQQIEYFDFRQFKKFYNKHRYIPDK